MKRFLVILLALAACGAAPRASAQSYTNFIRQIQYPSGVVWDATVAASGTQQSALSIEPGGARFELWTVRSQPLTSYLLDQKVVGAYVPLSWVFIFSEDPYDLIPRTRADRPFVVYIYVAGLLSGADVPESTTGVNLLRHVQSYGPGGDGTNINRDQATLHSQSLVSANGWQILSIPSSAVPGSNLAKRRGEERFSVFSLPGYQVPASQIASKYIQIWPVADGSISGITSGALIKNAMPEVTLTMNDLYPDSTVFAKVYQGPSDLSAQGAIVPGSAMVIAEPVPQNRVLTISDWNSVLTDDGEWTLDLMTTSPFGTERLASVTFTLDRAIKVNGSITTAE